MAINTIANKISENLNEKDRKELLAQVEKELEKPAVSAIDVKQAIKDELDARNKTPEGEGVNNE